MERVNTETITQKLTRGRKFLLKFRGKEVVPASNVWETTSKQYQIVHDVLLSIDDSELVLFGILVRDDGTRSVHSWCLDITGGWKLYKAKKAKTKK